MTNVHQRGARRLASTILLCGAAFASAVPADAQTSSNPKPEMARDSCTATSTYRLAASTPPTGYRVSSTTAPGGYDPGAQFATCGNITNAQPLTCVDGDGKVAAPGLCSPDAQRTYEDQNSTTVYNSGVPGLEYYTTASTRIGGGQTATAIRITSGIVTTCIQLGEIQVFEGGTDMALASSGSTVQASPPYSSEAHAGRAIDGDLDRTYPNIYHSLCRDGDYITVTFPRAVKVDRVVLHGRNGWGERDVYDYQLLNGGQAVNEGRIDARSGTGTATIMSSCDPRGYEWRSVPGSTAGVCGTQQVPNSVECVVKGTDSVVSDALCGNSTRPAATRTVTSREGCGFDFTATAWSTVAPSCGQVTQTRTVACQGVDGQPGTEGNCANYLTPQERDLQMGVPDSSYWSKGDYAWPGAAGDKIKIWRMPTVCDLGDPKTVRDECEVRYVGKAGANQAYLRPKSSRSVTDHRSCTDSGTRTYHWNDPTYVPDATGVCGPNTRTGQVRCLSDAGSEVDASLCDPSQRPASTQSFEDTSGCKTKPETTPAITALQVGWCGYTSSGKGRYACGERPNYRPGPAAPYPQEMCTGNLIAGSADGTNLTGAYQTPRAGKGWTKPPVTENVPGARCAIHWRSGYSDSDTALWISAYYDGPATGRAGGLFIGPKP